MQNTMELQNPSVSSHTVHSIKVVKEKTRRINIMRFNQSLGIDSKAWKNVRMERENNYKEFKLDTEDNPKYGLGSEYGRENRDEARRKKYGIITKKYNPDDQPWILKFGGKNGKKFKGIREGGVTENVSYYVFKKVGGSQYEAHPVMEWYNFTPIQCYKTLSPEEAEEAYGRREKVFNYFSIMTQKRLRADAGGDDDAEEKAPGGKKKKKKAASDFKITDFDEVGNDLGSDISESDREDQEEKSSKKKKVTKKKGKKKKDDEDKSDDEALEESDEGDFDDKEVDYMTNSSSSEGEIGEEEKTNRDMKGVEDEEALRKLMSEDEEENAEEEEAKEAEENGENKEKAAEAKPKQKRKKSDSSAESSSESSDSDYDDPKFTSAIFVPKSKKKNGSDNSAGSSRANTPTKNHGDKDSQKGIKRKFGESSPLATKKQKTENQSSHSSSALDGINEETVRRYLQRKPMTAVELLHKFKSKKTKMSSQQLVQKIADVLKRMDLQKSNIKGKMYLSVKNA